MWVAEMISRTGRSASGASTCSNSCSRAGPRHAPFTETLVSAGADVVVTEMSATSAELLRERFRHSPAVTVRHDPDGNLALASWRRRRRS